LHVVKTQNISEHNRGRLYHLGETIPNQNNLVSFNDPNSVPCTCPETYHK